MCPGDTAELLETYVVEPMIESARDSKLILLSACVLVHLFTLLLSPTETMPCQNHIVQLVRPLLVASYSSYLVMGYVCCYGSGYPSTS
jgi:hypothetical protein